MTVKASDHEFHHNTASAISGGVLYPVMSNITIVASRFHRNNYCHLAGRCMLYVHGTASSLSLLAIFIIILP